MADVMEVAKTGMSGQGAAELLWHRRRSDRTCVRTSKSNEAHRQSGGQRYRDSPLADILAYQRDAWERWILFLDTLRQRAHDLLTHDRAGKPLLRNNQAGVGSS